MPKSIKQLSFVCRFWQPKSGKRKWINQDTIMREWMPSERGILIPINLQPIFVFPLRLLALLHAFSVTVFWEIRVHETAKWPLALLCCFTSVCFLIPCLLQHSTLMCYSGISASGNQFCFCLSCKVLHLSKLFLNSYGSAPRQLTNHRTVCVVLTRAPLDKVPP